MNEMCSVDATRGQSLAGDTPNQGPWEPESHTPRPTTRHFGQRWLWLAPSSVVFLPIGLVIASITRRTLATHDGCGNWSYPAWVGAVEALLITAPLITFFVALAVGMRCRRRLMGKTEIRPLEATADASIRVTAADALWWARAAVFVSAVGLLAWPIYAVLISLEVHPLELCFGWF